MTEKAKIRLSSIVIYTAVFLVGVWLCVLICLYCRCEWLLCCMVLVQRLHKDFYHLTGY